jgi:hypothetical protein
MIPDFLALAKAGANLATTRMTGLSASDWFTITIVGFSVLWMARGVLWAPNNR